MVDSEIKLNEKDAVHIRRFCAVCKGSCSTVILQVRNEALRAFLAAADSAKLSCETRRLGRRIGQTRPRLCVGAIPALRSCRTRRGDSRSGGMVVMAQAMTSSSASAKTGRSASVAQAGGGGGDCPGRDAAGISIPDQGRWLASALRGHYNYYAVPDNGASLRGFRWRVTRHWLRALRRRSQRTRRLNWKRMDRLADRWLPQPRILHP